MSSTPNPKPNPSPIPSPSPNPNPNLLVGERSELLPMPLVRFLRLVLRSLQRAAQRADLVVEIADLGVEIVGAAAPAAPSW